MRHRAVLMLIIVCLCACILATTPVYAGDKDAKGRARLATEAEVAEALAQFKVDFAARGIPKDEVVSQRNYAMKKIAPVQHPEIIKALAKITKHRNKDLRTLALIYLGDQRLHPHLAAQPILASMKKYKRDKSVLMTGLRSLCTLKYLGARKEIAALLQHKEFAVKKLAIAAVGAIDDIRMLKDILRLLGVDLDKTSTEKSAGGMDSAQDSTGQKDSAKSDATPKKADSGDSDGGGDSETTDPGYSWGGVDVFVPEGEDPEAAVKAAQEKNRKEAEAAARGRRSSGGGAKPASTPAGKSPSSLGGAGSANSGGSGSGTGATGSASRGSGASSRGATELIPAILVTLKKLTGVKFTQPDSIKIWVTQHEVTIRMKQAELDRKEKAQKGISK